MGYSLLLGVLKVCRHAQFLALVPIPLGHLTSRHPNLRSDPHFGCERPLRANLELLLENSHLKG